MLVRRPTYTKFFTRDIGLPFLSQIVSAERTGISKILSLDLKPVYLVGYGHDGYVEQFMNSVHFALIKEKLAEKLIDNTNFYKLLESNYLRCLKEYKTSRSIQTQANYKSVNKIVYEMWPNYVMLLHLSYLKVPKLFGQIRKAKVIRGETADIFDDINFWHLSTLASLYPSLKVLVKYLTIDEAEKGTLPWSDVLKKRAKSYWLVDRQVFIDTIKGDIEKEFKISLQIEEIVKSDLIKGTAASTGKVRGVVKKIMTHDQIPEMPEKGILVTAMTTPSFLPAIAKASAIVTDEGGTLSHAAIIARELRIPCIVGTKIATKVLKDGDLVEVDAEKGMVTKIK